MVKVSSFLGMTGAAFLFWIAFRQIGKPERMAKEAEERRASGEIWKQQRNDDDSI